MDVAGRFGNNLAAIREEKELTQEQLATLAGIHRTQVGLLEAGKRQPRLATLIKLAGALGVEPAELLDGLRWVPASSKPGRFVIK